MKGRKKKSNERVASVEEIAMKAIVINSLKKKKKKRKRKEKEVIRKRGKTKQGFFKILNCCGFLFLHIKTCREDHDRIEDNEEKRVDKDAVLSYSSYSSSSSESEGEDKKKQSSPKHMEEEEEGDHQRKRKRDMEDKLISSPITPPGLKNTPPSYFTNKKYIYIN